MYKPKGIVALYYYYRYLLNLHKKQDKVYKLTPEMRAELKKLDQYTDRVTFVYKNKIETVDDINKVQMQKEEELQKILNTRNRLYYKRQNLENQNDKDKVTKEIIAVTRELKKVRKDIRLCDDVYVNVKKIKKQLEEMEKREKGQVLEGVEKAKKKKKEREGR